MSVIKPFPTRLSNELREYLRNKSDEKKRSLNNEIADRLEITREIEELMRKPLTNVIDELRNLPKITDELEKTKKNLLDIEFRYNSLKKELDKAFSLSGNSTQDIARMKIQKSLNYIQSGLSELKTIFPDENENENEK